MLVRNERNLEQDLAIIKVLAGPLEKRESIRAAFL